MIALAAAQDVAGGAVVSLQLDHARARVVALEVEDVADVGAAPAVDRLVLVADDGDAAGAARQQAHQPVLDAVGVLELVDQHVIEALSRSPRPRACRWRTASAPTSAGRRSRSRWRPPAAPRTGGRPCRRRRRSSRSTTKSDRAHPLVLGAIDRRQHLAHGEHPLRHLEIDQHAREQALLIVVVVDDEVLAQADRLAPLAQDARAPSRETSRPTARACRSPSAPRAACRRARAARPPPCW